MGLSMTKKPIDIIFVPFLMSSPIMDEVMRNDFLLISKSIKRNAILLSAFDIPKITPMIETLGDRLEFFQSCLSHPYQIPKNYNIVNIHVLFMPTLGDKMKLTEDALELIHRGRISFDERERRYKFGQSMINLHEVLQTPIEGNIHHYVIDPKEIDVQSITKKPVKKHFFHPLQGEDVIVKWYKYSFPIPFEYQLRHQYSKGSTPKVFRRLRGLLFSVPF